MCSVMGSIVLECCRQNRRAHGVFIKYEMCLFKVSIVIKYDARCAEDAMSVNISIVLIVCSRLHAIMTQDLYHCRWPRQRP